MSGYYVKLDNLIKKLRENLRFLMEAKETPLVQVKPPKSPGVYMLFFEGKLQYVGSSGNLNRRIRTNLLSGNRESHTLINKLCELRMWDVPEAVSFLKSNSSIKLVETKTEDDAKLLEDVLIGIYHPLHNAPLRKLKKETQHVYFSSSVTHVPDKRVKDEGSFYKSLDEVWKDIQKYLSNGSPVHTLVQGVKNSIISIEKDHIKLKSEKTEKIRTVPRSQFEIVWNSLVTDRRYVSVEHKPYIHSQIICAILAHLYKDYIEVRRNPLTLYLKTKQK